MSEDRHLSSDRDGDLVTRSPSAATERPSGATAPRAPRSRRAVVVGAVAGVVVLAGAAALLSGTAVRVPGAAPTPEVVVLPSPTPTIAPVARTPLGPFADSLPAGVLDFALTGVADDLALLRAGAVEAYRLEYSDGGARTLTVLAGQWPTPAEAVAAYPSLVAAAGTPATDGGPATGPVLVDGAVVGDWAVTTPGDGLGTVTWVNGTAVLQLTGPADVVRDAYAAYPY